VPGLCVASGGAAGTRRRFSVERVASLPPRRRRLLSVAAAAFSSVILRRRHGRSSLLHVFDRRREKGILLARPRSLDARSRTGEAPVGEPRIPFHGRDRQDVLYVAGIGRQASDASSAHVITAAACISAEGFINGRMNHEVRVQPDIVHVSVKRLSCLPEWQRKRPSACPTF
jgi:hypothetical protein